MNLTPPILRLYIAMFAGVALLTMAAHAQMVQTQGAGQDTLFADTLEQAKKGDAHAQNLLGAIYQADRKIGEAVKWYTLAASQRHAAAQANLGSLFMDGTGVSKDFKKGIELLKLSAAQKLPLGIAKLGLAYLHGQDGGFNRPEGLRLLHEASDMGDGFAAYQIGITYLHGQLHVLPKNEQEAIKWFRTSAERGYPAGQLAYARYAGNASEQMKWYLLAANGGHRHAQYILGNIYNNPSSPHYDQASAVRWYRLATENGHNAAEQALFHMGLPGRGGRLPVNPVPAKSTAKTVATGDIAKFAVAALAVGLAIAILSPGGSSSGASNAQPANSIDDAVERQRKLFQCRALTPLERSLLGDCGF